MRPNKR